jgi:hypothetical protein
LISEKVDVLGLKFAFDVVPSANFEVSSAVVIEPAFGVSDVPLAVPCIVGVGVLLLERMTQKEGRICRIQLFLAPY